MKESIAIIALCLPTFYELINDINGDNNHAFDVFVRVGLVLLVSIWPWYIGHSYIAAVFFAGGIFTLTFDYLENLLNLRLRNWFSYLGTTSKQDRVKWWRAMKPWNRFYLRVGIFTGTLVWYVIG